MCSSPPGRTPKSKLAVEQPSTGGPWNLPKKIPHAQRQRSFSETVEGHNHDKIKSQTHWVGD